MSLKRKPLKRKGNSKLNSGGLKSSQSQLKRQPLKKSRDSIMKRRSKPTWAKKGSEASKLLVQCDRFFSLFKRAENSEGGICTCYTCGKKMPWVGGVGYNRSELGHYFSRGNQCTRFSSLTKIQCNECNQSKGGNLKVFKENLIEEFGKDRFEEERELSRDICSPTKDDLKQILHKYKILFYKECTKKGLEHSLIPKKWK